MKPGQSALCCVALVWSCACSAADWVQDGHSSRLDFAATYEGQPATGRFRDFATRLSFDPGRPEQGRLDVDIDTASAEMDSADMTRAIRAGEWLDAVRFPKAQFRSTEIARQGPGRYLARGRLTVKGVTRDVKVPFGWSASGRTASMTGEVTVDRTDYRVGTGEWASGDTIGRDVGVRFRVSLRRTD